MAGQRQQIAPVFLGADGTPMNPAMRRIACDETIRFLRLTVLGQLHPEIRRVDGPFVDYRDTPAFAVTGDALRLIEKPNPKEIEAFAGRGAVTQEPERAPEPATNIVPFVPRHSQTTPESYGYSPEQLDTHAASGMESMRYAESQESLAKTASPESTQALLRHDDVLDIQKHTVIAAVEAMQNAIAEDPAAYIEARKNLTRIRGLAELFSKQYIASLIQEYDVTQDSGAMMGGVKKDAVQLLEKIFSDPLFNITHSYSERYSTDGKAFASMQEAMQFADLRKATDRFAEMNLHRLVNAYIGSYYDNLIEQTQAHIPLSFLQRKHLTHCIEAYDEMLQQSKQRHWQTRVQNTRSAGEILNAIQEGTWRGENRTVPRTITEYARGEPQTWAHR